MYLMIYKHLNAMQDGSKTVLEVAPALAETGMNCVYSEGAYFEAD